VLPEGEKVKVNEVTGEVALPGTWKPITKIYDIAYSGQLRGMAKIIFKYDPSKLQNVNVNSL